MAGNASEQRGREYTSRERDSKRAPTRVASKERLRSPALVTAAASQGRAHDGRTAASSNTRRPHSPSSYHRPHSTSRSRHQGHDVARHRPRSPDQSRGRSDLDTLQAEKAGEDKASSKQADHRQSTPAKRRYKQSPSPSRHSAREPKRRRSRSHNRSYSPRPARDERAAPDERPVRRISPDYHQRHPEPRRRSPSVDSRYRRQPPSHPRRLSPENHSRAREHPRDRYRSPPRYGRRRYSPPPPRRSYRDSENRDPHYRYEDRYGTRHSKPAVRSPSREPKRSPSPSDLISQLATNRRREEAESSRQRPAAQSVRRTSRSPRRDYRDETRHRGRDRGRAYDTTRRDHYESSPRRHHPRDRGDEEAMYGRGGYARPPPQGRPQYVDPRYQSHSPPYPPQVPTGPSPQHAHSPYGRGGYAAPPGYGSYHGSPMHAYSPQQSPYYAQGYPPAASPYHHYQQPQQQYAAPPQIQQQHPPQQPQQQGYQSYPRPPPRNPSYGPPPQRPTGPTGPPPANSRSRGGHFANLSWTPSTGSRGGKISSNNATTPRATSSSGAATPAAAAPPSVDDDDNPFRPPKDLRAEDQAGKNETRTENKPGISFSIKGNAEKAHAPLPIQLRKELVMRKRLKPKPTLSEEFAASDSVYFRKVGNESVIGSGTYGKVYKAVHVYTNDKVALKKIRMEGERDGFPVTAIREIKLLQSLNHHNIVKLQEVMVESNDCFMVFEYLSHDLTGLLNHPSFTLTPAHKKHLAKQLFEGLDYLHKRGVLHRDIKAANILVSRDGELKLADFGLARFYNKNAKRKQDYTNRVITIWYRSPELLLGETQYGPSVDVWSAACVLVEIFTRHAIFPGDGGEINQLDKIYNVLGTPSRAEWPGIAELAWYELLRPANRLPSTFEEKYRERLSPAAFDLLSAMFLYDPNARPSASDVLEHPYFTAEEPRPQRAWGLKDLEGDWHEFESKALRKEKEREARRRDREVAEKRKGDGATAGDERDSKRARTSDVHA